MAVLGTIAFVCLVLGVDWGAVTLGAAYAIYMTAIAVNLGNVAEPTTAELNRVHRRWLPDREAPSIRERRIQAGLLAVFGLIVAGLGVAGL